MKKLFLLFIFIPSLAFGQNFREVWVDHDGISHYVRVFGEGEPILLINGGPGMNSNGFEGLASTLTDNYQVILYDQRGTGKSVMENPSPSSLTLGMMAADIEMIRIALEIDEWVVMGQSFGGILAYYYASKYPTRIRGMIQSSSGGMDLAIRGNVLIQDRLTAMQRDSLSYYQNLVNIGETEYLPKVRQFLAYAYVVDDSHAPQIANRLAEANMEINQMVWNNMAANEYDVKQEMLSFQSPVLIIQGELDVVDIKLAETAHAILPESTLRIVPRSGHYGWVENPDYYYGEIYSFLSNLE